jgi:TolB-like protein/DNA-binding winged helix-turn-helix (wHTH) protein
VFQFGDYKLDCGRFELYRAGRSVKLERKPMELLVLLAARNGHLVSRAEIAEHLWDKEVFVDTEHGINTAIRKIREVLNDDPAQSRFVQTVTGKGYRFAAPIVEVRSAATEERRLSPGESRNRRVGDTPVAAAPDGFPVQNAVAEADAKSPGTVEALRSSRPRRWIRLGIWLAAAGAFALVAVAVSVGARSLRDRSLNRAAASKIDSLAVLPLDNLSGDPGQNYFADGMTDELTTMLAKNSTVRVVSRTSAMQYKGVHRPLREIARELGVDGILEGSVERSGDKVHMTIQLIQASSDTHVWAESYDRGGNDVVSLPREAAQAIAKRLNSAVPHPAMVRYVSPEAHDAYLQGLFYWFMAGGSDDRAKSYFERAIQLQPDYAAAWSGLGDVIAVSAVAGNAPPSEAFAKAEPDIRKALALDDSLPEAHNARAAVYLFHAWDWQRAEAESRRSIELNPNYAEGHHIRAYTLWVQNRDAEALQEQKLATGLAPLDRPHALGSAYLYLRQFDAAIRELTAQTQFRRDFWTQFDLSEAYELKGMDREAAEHMAQAYLAGNDERSAAAIRLAFKEKGLRGVSEWLLNVQLAQVGKKYVSPWILAWNYAHLQRKDETLAALEEAYKERSPWLVFVQKEPVFDFLHGDERYRSIVRRVGLPPVY